MIIWDISDIRKCEPPAEVIFQATSVCKDIDYGGKPFISCVKLLWKITANTREGRVSTELSSSTQSTSIKNSNSGREQMRSTTYTSLWLAPPKPLTFAASQIAKMNLQNIWAYVKHKMPHSGNMNRREIYSRSSALLVYGHCNKIALQLRCSRFSIGLGEVPATRSVIAKLGSLH